MSFVRSHLPPPQLHDSSAAVAPYARTWNFEDDCPELCDDIAPIPHFEDCFQLLAEDRRPPFKWLFIGPQGARELHPLCPLHVSALFRGFRVTPLYACGRNSWQSALCFAQQTPPPN